MQGNLNFKLGRDVFFLNTGTEGASDESDFPIPEYLLP